MKKPFKLRCVFYADTLEVAIGHAGPIVNGEWNTTHFIRPENPFNDEVLLARKVLDIGCGCGRHLRYFMERTGADYIGLEPPDSQMQRWFWEAQEHFNPGYKERFGHRVRLVNSFDQLDDDIDLVVCTHVFQHFHEGDEKNMDAADIAKEVMKHTINGCVWILREHDNKDPGWIDRWLIKVGARPECHFGDEHEFRNKRQIYFIAFKEDKQ
jgi:SAM-dependent methyltransferase